MQSISRLSVIVFILVFNVGHRWFTSEPVSINAGHQRFNYRWCPNLNLSEISESESDALRIHLSGYALAPLVFAKFHIRGNRKFLISRLKYKRWELLVCPVRLKLTCQYKLLYTISNNIEIYEEPVSRTQKIHHCAVKREIRGLWRE